MSVPPVPIRPLTPLFPMLTSRSPLLDPTPKSDMFRTLNVASPLSPNDNPELARLPIVEFSFVMLSICPELKPNTFLLSVPRSMMFRLFVTRLPALLAITPLHVSKLPMLSANASQSPLLSIAFVATVLVAFVAALIPVFSRAPPIPPSPFNKHQIYEFYKLH